jgi:hypothetical protein
MTGVKENELNTSQHMYFKLNICYLHNTQVHCLSSQCEQEVLDQT